VKRCLKEYDIDLYTQEVRRFIPRCNVSASAGTCRNTVYSGVIHNVLFIARSRSVELRAFITSMQ